MKGTKLSQKCVECETEFTFTKKDIKLVEEIEKDFTETKCGYRYETQGSFLNKIKSKYDVYKRTKIKELVHYKILKCPVCESHIYLEELDRKEISRNYDGTVEYYDCNYWVD